MVVCQDITTKNTRNKRSVFDLISKDKVTLLDKKVKVVCQYNYSMVIDTNQQTSIMHIKSIILAKLQDNNRKYCSTKRSKNKEKGQFKLIKRRKLYYT